MILLLVRIIILIGLIAGVYFIVQKIFQPFRFYPLLQVWARDSGMLPGEKKYAIGVKVQVNYPGVRLAQKRNDRGYYQIKPGDYPDDCVNADKSVEKSFAVAVSH